MGNHNLNFSKKVKGHSFFSTDKAVEELTLEAHDATKFLPAKICVHEKSVKISEIFIDGSIRFLPKRPISVDQLKDMITIAENFQLFHSNLLPKEKVKAEPVPAPIAELPLDEVKEEQEQQHPANLQPSDEDVKDHELRNMLPELYKEESHINGIVNHAEA